MSDDLATLYGGVTNRRVTTRDLQLAKDRGDRCLPDRYPIPVHPSAVVLILRLDPLQVSGTLRELRLGFGGSRLGSRDRGGGSLLRLRRAVTARVGGEAHGLRSEALLLRHAAPPSRRSSSTISASTTSSSARPVAPLAAPAEDAPASLCA